MAGAAAPQGERPVHARNRRRPANSTDTPLDALQFGDPRWPPTVDKAKRVLERNVSDHAAGRNRHRQGMFRPRHPRCPAAAPAPFVAINCASIPESLIESELFGYRSGAFTGASKDGQRGKLLQANGGTLFLDEIGDMPVALQARLLRVLEEREVMPLGGETPVKLDIRLISATHCDLQKKIGLGSFREDLYYRLQGVTLTLPPLRERARPLRADPPSGAEESDEAVRSSSTKPCWPCSTGSAGPAMCASCATCCAP
jgi:transcriptional regulator of acetoin/glycerol metabolism